MNGMTKSMNMQTGISMAVVIILVGMGFWAGQLQAKQDVLHENQNRLIEAVDSLEKLAARAEQR